MRVIEITQPTEEPVTLAEQKLHSRLNGASEDSLLTGLITAARRYCEARLNRSFVATTWEVRLDRFPCGKIGLPRQAVLEVISITYTSSNGDEITLDPSAYTVVTGCPGYVTPAYGTSWPCARCHPDSVKIQFAAGYGDDATAVPETLKAAVRLVTAHLYENREASTETALNMVPMAVDALLSTEEYGHYE